MTEPKTDRTRNRRATITDHVPSVTKKAEELWSRLRTEIATHTDSPMFGTTFITPAGESFTTDIFAYPLSIVLQLAQSRDHNKHMDAYSDPDVDPIFAVRSVNAELVKGEWSQRGEGSPRITLLAKAIAEVHRRTLDEAQAALDQLNPGPDATDEAKAKYRADVKALRDHPAHAAVIARLQAEAAAAKAKVAGEKATGLALPVLFGDAAQ